MCSCCLLGLSSGVKYQLCIVGISSDGRKQSDSSLELQQRSVSGHHSYTHTCSESAQVQQTRIYSRSPDLSLCAMPAGFLKLRWCFCCFSFSQSGGVLCGVGKDSHNKTVSVLRIRNCTLFLNIVYVCVICLISSFRQWSFGTLGVWQKEVWFQS